MQKTLFQTADAGDFIRQGMQETLYQTADAGELSIRQRMQESLYRSTDAGDTLSDSGCRRHFT